MKSFEGLSLNPILTKSLAEMKYDTPTPIQAQAIPLALDGRDIMGSAQTGTGKTAAFAIPLVEGLLNHTHGTALVLTPTRELGKQVLGIMHELLGRDSGINTAFLIGGDSMQKQNNQLNRKPRLIVATPGRLNDHLERGNVDLSQTKFLVLDETDRMLDMGFSVQLDRIFKHMPKKRQTLMFSATLPKNIMEMSKKYLNNPERIAVGSTITPAKNIKQEVVRVPQEQKYDELGRLLETRAGTMIIFVKTKYGTERMAKRLRNDGFEADALHGDLKQSRRDRVLGNFRDMKFQILVATDVAARGLDVPHIQHVVNFDLPQVPEDFIHRIGRTARAGAVGEAVSFVSPQEGIKWHAIEMLMDPTMKGSSMPNKGSAKRRKSSGKPFDKKKGTKKYADKNNGKPASKKPFSKKSDRSDDRRDDKPFSKTKKGGKSFGGKKRFEKSDDNNDQRSDKKSYGKKRFEKSSDSDDKKSSNRSGGKSYGGKKRFEKSDDNDQRSDKKSYGKKRFEKSDSNDQRSGGKPEGKAYKGKSSYGDKKRTDGASSDDRRDGNGFAKRKKNSGGFKGKGAGNGAKSYGPKGGGKKFGNKPNKARPASGGGKRPKTRAA